MHRLVFCFIYWDLVQEFRISFNKFQGQFNGEAFIQMDSEAAALASAQQKHHKHMMFGKKQRYIEVFQCSGEDMNMVLNGGGYQSPPISKASGTLLSRPPQTSQPQPLQISIPSQPLTLSIPHAAHAASAQNQSSSLIAQQQQQTAQFIAQQNLMARQQAAAAAQMQAAAQQQSDQMAFLQNLSFMPSPGMSGAGGPGGGPGIHPSPYNFPMSPHGMPQIFYVPRPMLSMGQMGLMSHALGHNPYATAPPGYGIPPHPSMAGLQHAQMTAAGHSLGVPPPSTSALASSNAKRSYENAFRNDPMTQLSAAKRAYHHPNPNANNIYGTYPYPQI